jgi:hypothetical protein
MYLILSLYFINILISKKVGESNSAEMIFLNKNNKFIISKLYLELLEEYINIKTNTDLSKLLIAQLIDRSKIVDTKIVDTGIDNISLEMYNIYSSSEPFIICCSSQCEYFKSIDNNIFYLDRKTENIYNKIISNILEKSIVKVQYYEFKNNNEILKLFNCLKSLFKYMSKIMIIDREFNFLQNVNINHFLSINEKNIYTKGWGYDSNLANLKIIKKEIESNFKGRVNIYFTKSKELLHERRIIMNNITIESNQDLGSINNNDKSWSLTISINELEIVEINKKYSMFVKLN